ncbi:MAG: acyl carrier protein [Francisellaceae bacterium]|jgi:acyl carrier protein
MESSQDNILIELKKILTELFEVPENEVTLESKLYEDLDLDSIDAVDLIVHLQSITGRKFDPEEFKSVRTIDDVVTIIHKELSK